MKAMILDDAALNALKSFCDKDSLQNYIELVTEVADYICDESQDVSSENKKKMMDWTISLHDLKHELQDIRRTQL